MEEWTAERARGHVVVAPAGGMGVVALLPERGHVVVAPGGMEVVVQHSSPNAVTLS